MHDHNVDKTLLHFRFMASSTSIHKEMDMNIYDIVYSLHKVA